MEAEQDDLIGPKVDEVGTQVPFRNSISASAEVCRCNQTPCPCR